MPDFSTADFPCPHCLQDVLLDENTAGREIACPHCHEKVQLPELPSNFRPAVALKPISPKGKSAVNSSKRVSSNTKGVEDHKITEPENTVGLPARLADHPDAEQEGALPKAVLPVARRVEDITLKEGQAGGRARRLAPMPQEPNMAQPVARAGHDTPIRHDYKIAPVPARGDESLSGTPVVLPSERISTARTLGGKREPESAPAPESVQAAALSARPVAPREPKQAKGAVRLNNQRRVFTPQKEVQADLELAESWGQVETKPPVSRRYMILGVLTMIPIIMGLLIWGMKEVFRKKPEASATTGSTKQQKNEADIVRVAQAVLTKFHDARTIDEMARYVRHPEITKPRMEGWYQRPYPRFTLESFGEPQVLNVEGVDFIIGDLQLSGERVKSIALEMPDENSVGAMADDFRIDWESMVSWSEMTPDNFLAQESERACDFRVVLRRDSYPNPPYEDEGRWICFKINFPSGNFCYGYLELNSEVATEMIQPMRRASENGLESLNATVRLKFRPDARGRKNLVPQVSIERFRDGWLRVNEN